MDAKVLRAAVSAAIRVTVSTTLIGCGGNVSTDAGRTTSSPAVKDTPPSSGEPSANETEPSRTPSPDPKPTTAGGSAPTSDATTAGMASSGGSEVGGMAAVAGAGGEEASAGAPADVCGAAAHACLAQLEQTVQEPPSPATKACCDTVIATLERLQPSDVACFNSVNVRFQHGGVRAECCTDQSTWVHQACTPWGPPVPPELSRAALWSLAA